MGKRIIISESEKTNIRKMYGLINEQVDFISQYVSDPKLQEILREIETELGEKFTKEHFEKEIGMSGQIKNEAGGLLPEVIKAFEKMKNESGCNDIFIKEVDDKDQTLSVSYRTYDGQKRRFLNEAKNAPSGQKIDFAMKRVSIPGFSQHHTGLAIDYGGNTICLRKNAWPNGDFETPNKWGFTLPYMSGNIRMKEPWHLQYVGITQKPQITTQKSNQITPNPQTTTQKTNSNSNLSEYDAFAKKIRTETENASIDIDSIDFDFGDRTFTFLPGNRKIKKILLVIGRDSDGLTMAQNLEKIVDNVRKKYSEYNVTTISGPSTCWNCLIIGGKKVESKHQLLLIEDKNNEIESQGVED